MAELVGTDTVRNAAGPPIFYEAGQIRRLLAEAASAGLPDGPGLTAERAEALVAEIRAGRDA